VKQLGTDRANIVALRDNEITQLRGDIERLMNEAQEGGLSIAEMKKKNWQLEQDKAELLLLKVRPIGSSALNRSQNKQYLYTSPLLAHSLQVTEPENCFKVSTFLFIVSLVVSYSLE